MWIRLLDGKMFTHEGFVFDLNFMRPSHGTLTTEFKSIQIVQQKLNSSILSIQTLSSP